MRAPVVGALAVVGCRGGEPPPDTDGPATSEPVAHSGERSGAAHSSTLPWPAPIEAAVWSAVFGWDPELPGFRSWSVSGQDFPPLLSVDLGRADWSFDRDEAACRVELDLSASRTSAAAGAGPWVGVAYVAGEGTDDCWNADLSLLFGSEAPAEALDGMTIGLGGPLAEETAATFDPVEVGLVAGGSMAGVLDLPPSATAYTYGWAVDEAFALRFDEAQALLPIPAAEMPAATGGLARGVYVWESLAHRRVDGRWAPVEPATRAD